MLTGLFVAARIVANPVSNVFQKQLTRRGADPLFVIGITHALLSCVVLPFLGTLVPVPAPGAFWRDMVLCAALAVAGNALLVRALRSSDLSVLGPINAYKAVISLVLAVFVLGEWPTAAGLAGVALIVAGSYGVVDRAPGQGRWHAVRGFLRDPGVRLRFAALLLSATEAVFLKRALHGASPTTAFAWWAVLGLPIAFAGVFAGLGADARSQFGVFRAEFRTFALLALTTGVMQWTTLVSFGRMQVGYALALFQLSAVVSVLLGHRFFREGQVGRRLAGSLVMAAGAVLIVLFGRPR